jgi:hypothetical protein
MLEIIDLAEPIMGATWVGLWLYNEATDERHCFDQVPFIHPAIVWC